MARHCMRPGCDRPAAASLTYDTEAAAVWLDRPFEDGQRAQQVCGVHAATLTAPLGWSVTDRRLVDDARSERPSDGSPTLGSWRTAGSVSPFIDAVRTRQSADPVPAETAPTEPVPTDPVPTEPAPPEPLTPEPVPPQPVPSDPRPAVAAAQESVPSEGESSSGSAEPSDPHDEPVAVSAAAGSGSTELEPKPRGKLLDRAFEWTGPQHSVLTTRHDNRPRPKT